MLHPGPGARDSSRRSTYSTAGSVAPDPRPDSQSDTDDNGSQNMKVRKTMNHPITSICDMKQREKLNMGPSTFSKMLTFAVPTIVKKSALHIDIERKGTKRKREKAKQKWWHGNLKIPSFP